MIKKIKKVAVGVATGAALVAGVVALGSDTTVNASTIVENPIEAQVPIRPLSREGQLWRTNTAIIVFGGSNTAANVGQINANTYVVFTGVVQNGRYQIWVRNGGGHNGHGGQNRWINPGALPFMTHVGWA